mmetsp:Transcript_19953/g.62546  ORF Transcript_19953/g.62546 Transcript_19953/m.62546 type:complete len:213 (+) Transcript_19953:53-691(+)
MGMAPCSRTSCPIARSWNSNSTTRRRLSRSRAMANGSESSRDSTCRTRRSSSLASLRAHAYARGYDSALWTTPSRFCCHTRRTCQSSTRSHGAAMGPAFESTMATGTATRPAPTAAAPTTTRLSPPGRMICGCASSAKAIMLCATCVMRTGCAPCMSRIPCTGSTSHSNMGDRVRRALPLSTRRVELTGLPSEQRAPCGGTCVAGRWEGACA